MNKILLVAVLAIAGEIVTGCSLLSVEGDVNAGNGNTVTADVKVDSGAQVLSNNKIDSGAKIEVLSNNKIDSNVTNIVINKVVLGVDYDIELPSFGTWNKEVGVVEESSMEMTYLRVRPDTTLGLPQSIPILPPGRSYVTLPKKIVLRDSGIPAIATMAVKIKELGVAAFLVNNEWKLLVMVNDRSQPNYMIPLFK